MLKATDPETFAQPDKVELSGDVKIDIDGILGLRSSKVGDTATETTNGNADTTDPTV